MLRLPVPNYLIAPTDAWTAPRSRLASCSPVIQLSVGRILLALLASAYVCESSNADLIIDVTGAPGSTTTTWSFSGSVQNVSGGSTFTSKNNGSPQSDEVWQTGAFNNLVNKWFEDATALGSVVVSVTDSGNSTQQYSPDAIYLNSTPNDELALSLGTSDVAIASGDDISWTGSAVMDIAFDSLTPGTYTSSTFGGAALQLNIQAVPEPSGLSMLGIVGAVAITSRRNRYRRSDSGPAPRG